MIAAFSRIRYAFAVFFGRAVNARSRYITTETGAIITTQTGEAITTQ